MTYFLHLQEKAIGYNLTDRADFAQRRICHVRNRPGNGAQKSAAAVG